MLPSTQPLNAVVTAPDQESHPQLRKAVEAIAIKPRAGKLTLLSRKLFNILLAKAQGQGLSEPVHSMPLSELCSIAQFDSGDTELVKEHLRKMVSTTVEWSNGVKGARRWGITTLIGGVELIENGQRCTIQWTYSEQIKEKLLAPNVYTRLSLQFQNSFRSAAALALYEICVRYVDSPGQLTMRMPWVEWRPTLTGTPDSDKEQVYSEYKYFKRDVLKPSAIEVNALTQIEVELIEHKKGRSVADIQFSVKPKQQSALDLADNNIFDMSLVSRMLELGLSQAQAEKLYADHDEGQVRAALDYTEQRVKQKPPIENVPGYFRRALTEAYGYKPPGVIADEKRKVLENPIKTPPPVKTGALAAESLTQSWWSEKKREARVAFEAMNLADQEQLVEDFATTGLPVHLANSWQKHGLKNKMCETSFNQWLVRELKPPTEGDLFSFGLENGLLTVAGSTGA